MARPTRPERLTVILPVRNGAPTLHRAVTSTLRALPGDGVLLVHDDASTDETAAVLATVHDPRLRTLRSEEARGVAGGLNHLLEHVDTPLVARMDADDVVLPWRFVLQRRALTRSDVVFCTVARFGDVGPGGLRPGPPLPISAAAMPLHLLLDNPVAHSTMLARTSVVQDAGGYRAAPAEDYDLWLRLAGRKALIERLGAPALLYRVHAGQLTASDAWRERALADPAVREAYTDLARALLGSEPSWLDDLRQGNGPTPATEAFRESMTAAAAGLPAVQRRFLLLKLAASLRRR